MLDTFLLRPVLTFLLKLFFRVELHGREHFFAAGERVVIIANHQSFLDPLLMAVFMPQKPSFAINIYQADKWYFSWFDKVVRLYRLDPTKPMSMKRMIHDLREKACVVIFPEGRITTSGGIMKIYDGTSVILEKTGATLLTVRIDGADYSKVSRLGGKLRQRCFPKVAITILPPRNFVQGEKISPRAIYDIMTHAAFTTGGWQRTLLDAILAASDQHGSNHVIASDFTRANMSYRQMFTRAFILSQKLAALISVPEGEGDYIGFLLPGGLGAIVTFIALHMLGRIPCMLNFTSGEANLKHACYIATVKTILTSRVFVEKGKLEPVIEALQKDHRIIYLEDIRKNITLADKLDGSFKARYPRNFLSEALERVKSGDTAVVLYTSGSEGTPKGVALSHANILANVAQARARLDLMPCDILFNALPIFHSFGLSIGMLMPLVCGLKTFLYPTPLHYRVIPELIYDTDATIVVGTDTFYNGYAHYANPYDFWKIRLAVAGAEKLKESTRRLYADRFRVDILEGYGVTETSPVISVNTPMEHKAGTVGRIMPGMEWKTEKVEGLKGGRLFVKGPNVMRGYLKADQPGVVQPQGEWYDTGDIVEIDEEGFIAIAGRAKRFAKIGGEMVSLMAVEEFACGVLPDAAHAAIAIPDERKGEQIILFTESKELTREQLVKYAREKGIPEISLPRQVIHIEAIARLGTGKIDYPALSKNFNAA